MWNRSKCFLGSIAFAVITLPAGAQQYVPQTVNAAPYIGAEYMQSPHHRVEPLAVTDGYMLRYTIETPYEKVVITGTEHAKQRIHEIHATEALRRRSTGGEIIGAAKDRTTNLVKTPYRIGKTLVNRAGDISNLEEAVLFVPKQVGQAAGDLIDGIGELGVTALRITKGAADTKCSGFDCVEKAGEDIWSGVNSLAGKHDAARRLHAEFGTDPQTENKAYRKQINRLAYANAYTGTTVKLGTAQAGIDYLSPAFIGVGYINNAEFVGGYQDADRQNNHEKNGYKAWGANLRAIEDLFENDAFTQLNRRRLFTALDAIPNKDFAVRLLHDVADSPNRSHTQSHLALYEYISALAARGEIRGYINDGSRPLISLNDGTLILPIYSDYLQYTPELTTELKKLKQRNGQSALHVLGYASPEVKQGVRQLGIQVVEWPGRARRR